MNLLEVHRDDLLNIGARDEDFSHFVAIEPLDTLNPVNIGVKPRFHDQGRWSIGLIDPTFEGILHLEGGLDVKIEGRHEIGETKVGEEGIFLVWVVGIE